MATKTTLELEQFIPYRLSILDNTVSRALASLYSERFDLTVPEWRVIAVLGASPGLSAGQVAERTAMDKVAVSRAVNSLVESGRLTKETSADDRRRSSLNLSDEGETVYARVVPMARALERELLAALSDRDLRTLDELLSKLQRQADQLGE